MGGSSIIKRESEGKRKPQGCSKTMKRNKRGQNFKVAAILALPNELIIEILAHVAAFSLSDLFSAKLSCKKIYEAAEDDNIYRRASLERLPISSWRINKQASSFLDRCNKSGNPEALFRHGVVEYFSHMKLESGLRCLRRASKSGHFSASYILGVILLCSKDEYKRVGMKLLDGVRRKKRIGNCRQKLKDIMWSIWLKNKFILKEKPNGCPSRHLHKKRVGWPRDNVDDGSDISCQECSCYDEVVFVCKLLRGV